MSRPVIGQMNHDFRLLPDPELSASSQRAYFVYEATVGGVIKDAVVVRNESKSSQHLSLFAADTMTASRGGIAVASHSGAQPEDAGAWIDLSQTDLHLEPHEHRSVAFTLRLPNDLLPGEYAASIVAQKAEEREEEQGGAMGIRFIPRFAVTVLITVLGSSADTLLPHLDITDLTAATGAVQQTVIADLSNSGNDGLKEAEGSLTIRQTNGQLVQEQPVRLGYFLARDELDYRVAMSPALEAGEYDVTLSLTHERGTDELTRRLFLGELPKIPVVSADAPIQSTTERMSLPRWVTMTIAAAAISIVLLLLLLTVQSRKLARARLRRQN